MNAMRATRQATDRDSSRRDPEEPTLPAGYLSCSENEHHPEGADEMAYVVAGIVSKTDKGGIIEVTARSVPPAKVVERWRAEGDG